ncbi:hypothetical protein KSP40_PGU020771 [Platanthera guangdongensis]|uniref:Uncharacterized protein n=1 Tax=Platanthera guangdongensis TaxID=2320717 RepID=A0ABR2MFE0_9ASPA
MWLVFCRESEGRLGGFAGKEKNESKLEQIKASVILPFYSFSSQESISRTHPMEYAVPPPQTTQSPEQTFKTTTPEDIMPLEIGGGADDPQSPPKETQFAGTENLMSLSDLSAGFQRCSEFASGRRSVDANHRPSQEPPLSPELTPFDYASARRNFKFGAVGGEGDDGRLPAARDARKGFRSSRKDGEERERGQQPRRRQAFPPSGNRSATYRC